MAIKPMLSIDELVEHMKAKGIRFNIVSEEEAKEFLTTNNYYMKLASYRANYDKCPPESKRAGEYQQLEFAYLQELSTIDMHLRYIVMQMCLDIEHTLKVKLLAETTADENEDGYRLVKSFFREEDTRMTTLSNIRNHKSGEYCSALIEKYYPYFPIWVFVELISFRELLHLISYYEKLSGKSILLDDKLMNIVRDLRNACAHSNCLLNKMCQPMDVTKQPAVEITGFVKPMIGISPKSRRKYLKRTFPYSMVVLLYAYDYYEPQVRKQKRYQELKDFQENRVLRHKEYFITNPKIIGTYRFLYKIVDNLASK